MVSALVHDYLLKKDASLAKVYQKKTNAVSDFFFLSILTQFFDDHRFSLPPKSLTTQCRLYLAHHVDARMFVDETPENQASFHELQLSFVSIVSKMFETNTAQQTKQMFSRAANIIVKLSRMPLMK